MPPKKKKWINNHVGSWKSWEFLPKDILFIIGEYLSFINFIQPTKIEIREREEKCLLKENNETLIARLPKFSNYLSLEKRKRKPKEWNELIKQGEIKNLIQQHEIETLYFKTLHPSWYDILPISLGTVKRLRWFWEKDEDKSISIQF